MEKKMISKEIHNIYLGEGDNRPFFLKDLPEDVLPTDEIYIIYDEGHYSENNSWDACTCLIVIRESLETGKEFEERKLRSELNKERNRKLRYDNYLKLKEEFEPQTN